MIASQGALRIQLPVNAREVTAIGYHGAGGDALPPEPLGRQKNEGLFSRLFHRVFGGGGSGGDVTSWHSLAAALADIPRLKGAMQRPSGVWESRDPDVFEFVINQCHACQP